MSNLKSKKEQLSLERLKVPFLYACESKRFDVKKIEDEIRPLEFEKGKTKTAIGHHLSKDKDEVALSGVFCFSLENVVVVGKVVTITVKQNNDKFTEEEIEKRVDDIKMPLIGKISQLITTSTEQITGVPYLVNFTNNN